MEMHSEPTVTVEPWGWGWCKTPETCRAYYAAFGGGGPCDACKIEAERYRAALATDAEP